MDQNWLKGIELEGVKTFTYLYMTISDLRYDMTILFLQSSPPEGTKGHNANDCSNIFNLFKEAYFKGDIVLRRY